MNSGFADFGRLLAWASRAKEHPGRHEDYHRLVTLYLSDEEFADAADAVFSGAGLALNVDQRDGAIVTAFADSPLRFTTTDIVRPTTDTHRSIVGLVLLAVARTAYPEPAVMDDPDHIAVFTTNGVVDTLDRAVSLCLEEADPDGDADEDIYEAFRRWNDKRRTDLKSGKVTKTTKPGIVNSVCRFLVDAGHLTARGDTDGGTWSTRPRFRHAVIALSEDSDLYRMVNDLIDAEVAP